MAARKKIDTDEWEGSVSGYYGDEVVLRGYKGNKENVVIPEYVDGFGVKDCDIAWNIVKLGGHYFHIDATWDDMDSEKISYDWFMKSDAELKEAGGAHGKWKIYKLMPLHSFQSDVMPECRYSCGDLNTDGEVGVSDLVKMSRYLLGKETISDKDQPLSDLDLSGNTDIFDMVKLRKLLLDTAK